MTPRTLLTLILATAIMVFTGGCWYEDADGDGFGDSRPLTKDECLALGDTCVEVSGDCNDTDPDINPDATEEQDGVDNDCDGQVDEAPWELAHTSSTYDEDIVLSAYGFTSISSSDVSTACGSAEDTVIIYNIYGDLVDTVSTTDLSDVVDELDGTYASDVVDGAVIYVCEGSGTYEGFELEGFEAPFVLAGTGDDTVITSSSGRGIKLLGVEGAYLTGLVIADNRTDSSEPRGGGLKAKTLDWLVASDVVFSDNYAHEFGGASHLNGVAETYFFSVDTYLNELQSGSGNKGAGHYVRPESGSTDVTFYAVDSSFYGQVGSTSDGSLYLRPDGSLTVTATIEGSYFYNPSTDDIVVMDTSYNEEVYNALDYDGYAIVDTSCLADGSAGECTITSASGI